MPHPIAGPEHDQWRRDLPPRGSSMGNGDDVSRRTTEGVIMSRFDNVARAICGGAPKSQCVELLRELKNDVAAALCRHQPTDSGGSDDNE